MGKDGYEMDHKKMRKSREVINYKALASFMDEGLTAIKPHSKKKQET